MLAQKSKIDHNIVISIASVKTISESLNQVQQPCSVSATRFFWLKPRLHFRPSFKDTNSLMLVTIFASDTCTSDTCSPKQGPAGETPPATPRIRVVNRSKNGSRVHTCALILIALSLVSLGASASSKTLMDQRYNYELAKARLKLGDERGYQKHRATLDDYPLAAYLDYQYASRALSNRNAQLAENFIKLHRGSYLGERMQRRYLHYLGSKKDWSSLIYWYEPGLATQEITCKWLEARHKTGDATALENVEAIWVSAKSQPKACDDLFKSWFASEHYRNDFAWQRFLLAAESGQRGLARYVGSTLPGANYQEYINLVWELDARPYRIKKQSKFRRHTPEMQQVIGFGIKKFAKRHPVEALKLWEQYEASAIFGEALTKNIKTELARRLIKKKKMVQLQSLLASSPSIREPKVIEQLLRSQLRDKNWPELIQSISLLPEAQQKSDRWQYWRLRADLALNYMTKASALDAFEKLADKRSFYGFLSADILGKNYALQDQPTSFPISVLKSLAKRPAFQRAKELWLVGHTQEAHAEWYYGLDKLSARELAAAGVLAHSWGWYDRGIQAMIAGKHWNHLDVRFPLAYKEQILNAADNTELSAPFIFAVARQESAMFEQAKSPVGARGLMQLMPQTAMQTAQKQGIRHSTDDLLDADHNIRLGSQYLDDLLDKFDGNRILAAAAYNAGPHRVDRWTNNSEGLDFDIWIETIPFKETRGYVQNVLTYAVIYSLRLGSPAQLVTKSEANQKL